MATQSKIVHVNPETGEVIKQDYIAGAALVAYSPGAIPHIREKLALDGTAVTMDWTIYPIIAAVITACSDTAGTVELKDSVVLCVDPPSEIYRDYALTAADMLTVDAQRVTIPLNTPTLIIFTAPITKLGFKRDDGTGTIRLNVVGIGV
jgi:hypothetical protein